MGSINHVLLLSQLINILGLLTFLLIFVSKYSVLVAATLPNFPISKPNCTDRCGNISIPYPFGFITESSCYLNKYFSVTCQNQTKPFLMDGTIDISEILLDGQVRVMQYVASDCYARDGTNVDWNNTSITLPGRHYTVNNTANKFTVVGCDSYGNISGSRQMKGNYRTGCDATCNAVDDLLDGSCSGIGCCQTAIPKAVTSVRVELYSFENFINVRNFNNCSYAFVAEESKFRFSPANLTNLKDVEELPMLVDWVVGNNETCREARNNFTSYACKSDNSKCDDIIFYNGSAGYRCFCEQGYQGNPYLDDGCQDVDECKDPDVSKCSHHCENTDGSFTCVCPKGYYGDGVKDRQGCSQRESVLILKLVAGIAFGIIFLLLLAGWLYLELKRRKSNNRKQMFFIQNGGILLQEKLNGRERSSDTAKIFSSYELERATNDFHNNMIIGQGGYGTVYKGLLPDHRIIAIKKSKKVDPNQIDQFINEVIVLSQINHRNVVRLLGCCLETEVPLLVYEFISNGTLSAHIHNQAKARFFNWDMRLKIAAEAAGVLSYLHSAASTPIIHRDVKSDNILLDHTFTAKVADFGASKLVPLDHTQLSTMVQGTFGYLDPEYMQTNQLTEKSDVYSFGVVLSELLTGRKAISFDKQDEEKSLSNFFLSMLKQEKLFQILDENILVDGNRDQIIEVARLAQECLNVRGEDRPSMKEVAMELEGLRLGGKHSWAQPENNAEEVEYLLGEGLNGISNIEYGNSSSVGYDSIRDHALLPITGGR